MRIFFKISNIYSYRYWVEDHKIHHKILKCSLESIYGITIHHKTLKCSLESIYSSTHPLQTIFLIMDKIDSRPHSPVNSPEPKGYTLNPNADEWDPRTCTASVRKRTKYITFSVFDRVPQADEIYTHLNR